MIQIPNTDWLPDQHSLDECTGSWLVIIGIMRFIYTVFEAVYYAPAPRVGGIKRWCASDDWRLSVCLSRTSGLSREQRET